MLNNSKFVTKTKVLTTFVSFNTHKHFLHHIKSDISIVPKASNTMFFFFPFIFMSWRLITLQYCSGFCHTLTWISHGFTCIPHPVPPSHLPLHPIPLGLPSVPGLSTCLTHPTWAGVLHNHLKKINYVFLCFSQKREICCRKCFIKRNRDLKFKWAIILMVTKKKTFSLSLIMKYLRRKYQSYTICSNNTRKGNSPIHFVKPALLWYNNQIETLQEKKYKLISLTEYRYKIP